MKTIRNVIQFGTLCLGVTALIFGTAGCMVIPTPHSDTGCARTNLTTLTSKKFTLGQSTLEDVMLALGEPDAVSTHEQKLAYRSEKKVAVWVVTLGGYGSGALSAGRIIQEQFYVFEFDPQGRLQKTTRTGKILGKKDYYADSMGNRLTGTNTGEIVVSQPLPDEGLSNNVPSWVSGGSIRRIYPNVSWSAGYQDSRTRNLIGEQGRLVLTESNLLFFGNARFANDRPTLIVPLASVADVHADKYFLGQRVVVQTQYGEIHYFEIRRTGGHRLDKPAMQAACAFIHSKINPIPSAK